MFYIYFSITKLKKPQSRKNCLGTKETRYHPNYGKRMPSLKTHKAGLPRLLAGCSGSGKRKSAACSHQPQALFVHIRRIFFLQCDEIIILQYFKKSKRILRFFIFARFLSRLPRLLYVKSLLKILFHSALSLRIIPIIVVVMIMT